MPKRTKEVAGRGGGGSTDVMSEMEYKENKTTHGSHWGIRLPPSLVTEAGI